VVHIFAGERISDISTMKNLVKKVCSNYHIPYFTFSPTFSTCSSHGYIPGEHFTCPKCAEECEVYTRVVGFIRPVKQWNEGKTAEYYKRVTFKIDENAKPLDNNQKT
jgi:ribonucleoside-triphosphate reductase